MDYYINTQPLLAVGLIVLIVWVIKEVKG